MDGTTANNLSSKFARLSGEICGAEKDRMEAGANFFEQKQKVYKAWYEALTIPRPQTELRIMYETTVRNLAQLAHSSALEEARLDEKSSRAKSECCEVIVQYFALAEKDRQAEYEALNGNPQTQPKTLKIAELRRILCKEERKLFKARANCWKARERGCRGQQLKALMIQKNNQTRALRPSENRTYRPKSEEE